MDIELVELPSKGIRIATRSQLKRDGAVVVFVNGLMAPMKAWQPVIEHISAPWLAFDRPGQGESTERIEAYHDVPDTAANLRELLQLLKIDQRPLILVCNSIGAATVRLFAQLQPSNIAAVLFCDSMIANTDFVSIIPQGDRFEPARAVVRKFFHPTNKKNAEGLDRSKLAEQLPYSDRPKLDGAFVTVLGHAWGTFRSNWHLKMLSNDPSGDDAIRAFHAAWIEYNEGLATLTTPERSRGPIEVEGADHFIQSAYDSDSAHGLVDRPDVVADELNRLISLVATQA